MVANTNGVADSVLRVCIAFVAIVIFSLQMGYELHELGELVNHPLARILMMYASAYAFMQHHPSVLIALGLFLLAVYHKRLKKAGARSEE